MRELKFRSWFEKSKTMSLNFSLEDALKHEVDYVGDCVFMQYTGLKDKNGVDIYEVKYNSRDGFFLPVFCWDDDCNYIENQYSHSCEVIGNIYENKELLNE